MTSLHVICGLPPPPIKTEDRKINELPYELHHMFVMMIAYPQKAA